MFCGRYGVVLHARASPYIAQDKYLDVLILLGGGGTVARRNDLPPAEEIPHETNKKYGKGS
jgi:hypothetical protein